MPDILSPNTGRPIGSWTPTPEPDIAKAIASLHAAMAALAEPDLRRQLLNRLAAAITLRKAAFARVIVDEVGKTPAEASDEVDYAVSFITHAVGLTGYAQEQSSRAGDRRLRVVAAGPALLITPYNDPLAGITRKIAPALAAGCPAVVKPSSLGQLTAASLFEAIAQAGLGEFVHLVNHTDRGVLDRLVRASEFRVLSFTGSTEVGVALAGAAARGLKRLVMELGGNNPFLVLEGSDIDKAASDAIARKIRAAGQACSAQNRIYCVASLYDRFRERLFAELCEVTAGRSDRNVRMGPVRTERALGTLRKLAEQSRAYGAVHTLGRIHDGDGALLFLPTVTESDHVLREEEAFGPLMSLTRVASRREALAIAAAESQALAVYLYGDVSVAELAPLRFGSIGINTTRIQGPDVPTGGFRAAGIGREGSTWGLGEYLTTINERWA